MICLSWRQLLDGRDEALEAVGLGCRNVRGRGSKRGYSWSRVDVAGSGDGTLHRLPTASPAYWQGWNQLRATMGGKFHTLFDAATQAMTQTPRSSSLVENLNSRLRTYFTLRRHLGNSYLDLLRFFLNHRRFMRSRRAERNGKSPRELMTGSGHPHWLTLLGLGPLQPQRA